MRQYRRKRCISRIPITNAIVIDVTVDPPDLPEKYIIMYNT